MGARSRGERSSPLKACVADVEAGPPLGYGIDLGVYFMYMKFNIAKYGQSR